MWGRYRLAMVVAAVAVVVIVAALIVNRPVAFRDPPTSSLITKNVTDDSVEMTMIITPSTQASHLSVVLTNEGTGSFARANLNSTGVLQLADGRSFLLTYGDLNGDGIASIGDTVRITGPFTPGNYSIALHFDPTAIIICKTPFEVA